MHDLFLLVTHLPQSFLPFVCRHLVPFPLFAAWHGSSFRGDEYFCYGGVVTIAMSVVQGFVAHAARALTAGSIPLLFSSTCWIVPGYRH